MYLLTISSIHDQYMAISPYIRSRAFQFSDMAIYCRLWNFLASHDPSLISQHDNPNSLKRDDTIPSHNLQYTSPHPHAPGIYTHAWRDLFRTLLHVQREREP